MNDHNHTSTVYTVSANCQDCYCCVRACPVKAIRVSNGQAQIESDLCIQCGTCVKECPQKAKTIQESLGQVKVLIASGKQVVASVAPSFAAVFSGQYAKRVPSALRGLGFAHVSETAEGAKYITEKSFADDQEKIVCTACPAVISYVEKYKPEQLDTLIPIVSPMVAHGRILKQRYPDCSVVFIGPCAAKKEEALRPENIDAIDYVLTFDELRIWLDEEHIDLAKCMESGFDVTSELGESRLFPLQGGMLRTGGIVADGTDPEIIHLSGSEDVIDFFDDPNLKRTYRYVEPLFCKGGCISGPAIPSKKNLFERRKGVLEYVNSAHTLPILKAKNEVNCQPNFMEHAVVDEEISESQINKILEKTGKSDPESQLNCGSCGYKTCIDNARAVAKGMAEPEMCMPHMRRQAQQRSDRIIETSPNGVVALDSELNIIQMNPTFQKMFMCNNGVLGRKISYLINAEGFEQLRAGTIEHYESIQKKYGIRYHEILYYLPEEEQYIGIFSDISKIKYDNSQMNLIKSQTLMHAREFLDHQIRFSQEMANYLGRSTAQSEEIARRLISLYEEVEDIEGSK